MVIVQKKQTIPVAFPKNKREVQYWAWSYITFDTSTDTFSSVSWSLWSTMSWSDYINYWVNNSLSPFWATFNRTTLTWWVLWSWMPSTALFWWNTYW